jgi:hypothetical protein
VFFLGTGACFLLNALSYLPLALIVLVSRERCGQTTPVPGHVPDGTPAVDSHARGTLVLAGGFAFLGLPCFSLMPSITGEVLGGGLRSFSLVMTSVAAGAFAAAAVFWHDATRTRRHALIPWSVLVFAASLFALFAPIGAFGHCLFAAAAGAAVCVLLTLCNHSLQAGLENRARGRVTSLYAGVVLGLPPLGTLLLGGLGDMYGMRAALAIDCALLATLAVAAIAGLPRGQGRRTTTDAVFNRDDGRQILGCGRFGLIAPACAEDADDFILQIGDEALGEQCGRHLCGTKDVVLEPDRGGKREDAQALVLERQGGERIDQADAGTGGDEIAGDVG